MDKLPAVVHTAVSWESPWHWAPPLLGTGLLQALDLDFLQLPLPSLKYVFYTKLVKYRHKYLLLLQLLHVVQALHPPFIGTAAFTAFHSALNPLSFTEVSLWNLIVAWFVLLFMAAEGLLVPHVLGNSSVPSASTTCVNNSLVRWQGLY